MKNYKNIFLFVFIVALFVTFVAPTAHATVVPTISLTNVGSISSQLTVYGDPNSSVELHYGPSASVVANIGSTDQNGNLNTPVNTEGYLVACGNSAYVIVNSQRSQTIPWSANNSSCTTNTGTSSTLSFGQNNVVISVGETRAVTINGTGGYSISGNTSPSNISANISGSTLNLYGAAFGSSNITICANDGSCGVLYAVAVNNSGSQTSSGQLSLSSFSVSSSHATGDFLSRNSVLTITFSASEPLNNVSVRVANSPLSVSGNGSGPYTVTYIVTGGESMPIPVTINFSNLSGTNAQAAFALGNIPVATPVYTTNTSTNAPGTIPEGCTANTAFSITTGQPCGSGSGTSAGAPTSAPTSANTQTTVSSGASSSVFKSFLNVGSENDEVKALQMVLKALGYYSGPITGRFGSLTEAAVKKFQKAKGINQAGYVGPSTRAALNNPS